MASEILGYTAVLTQNLTPSPSSVKAAIGSYLKPIQSIPHPYTRLSKNHFNIRPCTVHLDTIKVFYLPTDAQ
jgi:hypothetical protein